MRKQNDKLKVYEFLYNRLPFSEDETEEFEAMQRVDLLEQHFDSYLEKVNTVNMDIHWHCEVVIGTEHEMINVLIGTEYCYYLFILHDYADEHYINPFNILINSSYEAVYDLNRTNQVYNKFKEILIDEGKFQRPIIIKHVVMNETFRLIKRPSEHFLSLKNLPYYLRAIEHSAVIRKKQLPPGSKN